MARTVTRHRTFLSMLGIATLIVGAALVVPSQAQTGGNPDPDRDVFELEGNARDSSNYAGEDWENVYEDWSGQGTSDASAVSFTSEPQRSASIFTGGGSKDPELISSWRWKDGGGLPDKDNLQDAFAARYGDLIVFGSDRYDNSGDAMQGFWFFQELVQALPGGTFSGNHTEGDLLILSDFSIGGTVSEIAVYEWVSAGGNVSEHLDLLFNSSAANCLDANGNPTTGDVCGIVNGPGMGNDTGGWSFTDKSGNHTYLDGEFFEGGIDLSAFDEFSGVCFSSFLSETRSSTSPTATLKDFVLGDFEACGVDIDTTPSAAEITLGETVSDHAVVTGSGIGYAPVPTGTMTFFVCGPDELDANGLCSTGGTQVDGASGASAEPLAPLDSSPDTSDAYADSAPFAPDDVGTWCFRGEYSGEKADPAPPNNYGPAVDYDVSECFTVADTSSIVSDQAWVPNDSATVTSWGGSALKGTLTFTLYGNGTCDGRVLYTESFDVDDPSGTTFTTSNGEVVFTEVDSPVSVSWQAVFDSVTDSADSTGPCEVSSLTIDDGDPHP
jgi:hypothetical protein